MRKRFNLILASVFLMFVFAVFFITTANHLPMLAWHFVKGHTPYLPENASVFDNVKARITSLQKGVNSNIYLKNEMRYLNAQFQDDIGRNAIEVSGSLAVRLPNGSYYDLYTEKGTDEKTQEIISFVKELKALPGKDIPAYFVYCHGGIYEDGMLSDVMESVDTSAEFADNMISEFNKAGIGVTDSREVYKEKGLTADLALLKSDKHWSHRMALETARAAAGDISKTLGVNLNFENLDYARFTDELQADIFGGEFYTRLGRNLVEKDDIHVLYPAYDTFIRYRAEKDGSEQIRTGTFEQAVIERDKLEKDEGKDYASNAYYIYGDYLAKTYTEYEDAGNDTRILIFKDSFGTPIAGFMTLAAREVYAVDLRSTGLSMMEIVEQIDPDCVIFAYCQQMMRNFAYEIQG